MAGSDTIQPPDDSDPVVTERPSGGSWLSEHKGMAAGIAILVLVTGFVLYKHRQAASSTATGSTVGGGSGGTSTGPAIFLVANPNTAGAQYGSSISTDQGINATTTSTGQTTNPTNPTTPTTPSSPTWTQLPPEHAPPGAPRPPYQPPAGYQPPVYQPPVYQPPSWLPPIWVPPWLNPTTSTPV